MKGRRCIAIDRHPPRRYSAATAHAPGGAAFRCRPTLEARLADLEVTEPDALVSLAWDDRAFTIKAGDLVPCWTLVTPRRTRLFQPLLVWLDDVRPPPDDTSSWFRTAAEVIRLLGNPCARIDEIS